ncbi:CopG domain protein DNA-binding domain protein [Thiocapsa sp. KS1]|nr:ribbon-helix-helix protein, CopG family [Thiocapsa sp. KS1]CRI64525.1 CopG domain protein DNA-binding domain protein [Thiocapsa sp. KS1]
MAGSTITVRTDPEVAAQIAFLAEAMDRSRNWVIEEALKHYIQAQSWQLEGIKQAQASLDRGEGIPFDAVMEEMDALIEQTSRTRDP